jgi:heme A synthase
VNLSFLRRFFTHLSSIFLFLTILAGALVHATGSGLACPDWPLCMGQYFPEMTGAVLFEHSHRLIAGTTGIIVWITGLLHLTSSFPFKIKLTSASLMVLIVIQAVLGGLTVLYQLPSWISTLHFLLAHVTFAGMLYISWYFIDRPSGKHDNGSRQLERLLGGASLLTLFFQMGLGAWLRHIGSKGAPPMPVCDNFPWCDPRWISAMTENYLLTYWTHRYLAVGVTLLIAATTLVVLVRKNINSVDVTICYWASIITLLQIVLGILTVRSSLSVLMAMFHTGGALILFTLLLWLNFRSQIVVGSPEEV